LIPAVPRVLRVVRKDLKRKPKLRRKTAAKHAESGIHPFLTTVYMLSIDYWIIWGLNLPIGMAISAVIHTLYTASVNKV
jgi:hypothetical protein